MDLKHNSTVVIALAIAVTVVMGMMIPIINDTINSGNSGNSGSPIAPAETITNEGIVYLEAMDLNMTPIEIRNGQDNVTVNRDGNTLYTFEKGNESWSIPLNLDMYRGTYGSTIGLFLLSYQVFQTGDNPEGYLKHLGLIYYDYPEAHIDRYMYNSVADLEEGGYISIATGGSSGFQMKVYDSEDQVTSTNDLGGTHIISDNGEYAYARSPTVASDTKLIMCNVDLFNDSKTIQGTTGYLSYLFNLYGVGSVSSWISNIETPQNILCVIPSMAWHVGNDSGTFNFNSLEYAVNTTETNGGIKVDNVTFTSVWGDANITETNILDKFIVPTTIELPQEGQNQGDYKYKRAESGFTADIYAVNGLLTTDPDDPSKTWDYGKYYDAFPILGDNFIVYADSNDFGIFANESTYTADYLTINGSTLIAHNEGEPDVSYENLRIFSWKDGDYLLNAAHTESYDSGHALYPVYLTDDTWFAALVGYNEGVMAQWMATVIGTPDDNSVNMAWYRENAFEEYDHNAEVTMNDKNKVTDIALTVDDQDYVFHPDSPTGEYMIFTYIPATIDNGGSGGSVLPPALVSILLAVPLIVLAGLVIMALRMLKLH